MIGLLDCNNFFVSCERLFRPDLAGKPVVVLSGNDGCIIARSQEVKALGIPMGMPYFKVRDELRKHGVTVFSSNFKLYRDISGRVMQALRSCIDEVQVYSIDEAFFSIESEDVERTVRRIKATVEQWVGVPVSIGVAPSKTMAKYASECAKEGSGVHVIDDMRVWQKEADEVPVALLWGVGRKTSEKFRQYGVHTVGDVLRTPRGTLRVLAGIAGERLLDELSGRAVHTLAEDEDVPQSIMSSRSFGKVTQNRAVVDDAIAYHIAHAAEKMRMHGCAARYLRVVLYPRRHGAYALRGGAAECMLPTALCDTRLILHEALQLADTLFEPDVPYAKVGVVLGNFVPYAYVADSLFPDLVPTTQLAAQRQLMDTVDALNARYGTGTVRPGVLAGAHVWEPHAEYRSQRYTTNWNELQTARA